MPSLKLNQIFFYQLKQYFKALPSKIGTLSASHTRHESNKPYLGDKTAVVNTNISASSPGNACENERIEQSQEQLSTGKKINTAADNAAGLAISSRMSSQIVGLDQSVQNAHDAISMIQTAESALDEMTNMLIRMRELALQASNGTTSVADRDFLHQEYDRLVAEIDRIANNTEGTLDLY